MTRSRRGYSALGLTAMLAMLAMPAGAAPSTEKMWEIIQQQQAEIERLKNQLDTQETQLQETEVRIEATASAVESAQAGTAGNASWAARTTLGGYAEMHYNNWENDLDTPAAGDDVNEIDFHRFVLFLGHEFTDRLRFFSEVELEHSLAGDGKEGEVELEQAYIEYDLTDRHRARGGLFLMPVGILNETHEPETFYGVERNNVEKNVIPTTWWEGGASLVGELAPGVRYDLAVTGGLGLEAGEWKVRDGRQKVSEARADALAYTGRVKYTAVPGLELAASVQYQEDLYQEEFVDVTGGRKAVDAWLYEVHAVYEAGPFGLRALYAEWAIDDRIEQVTPGAEKQEGWYVEPSWRFTDSLGVFARYSEWDNQAGTGLIDSEYTQLDVGINYWLHPQVVLKADYQRQNAPHSRDGFDGVNLGVGLSF